MRCRVFLLPLLLLVAPFLSPVAADHIVEGTYTATLTELNNSGVSGSANIVVAGDNMTVQITADGFEANQLVPQHIHGVVDDEGNSLNSVSPTLSHDTDGDGFIELEEGLPAYGPVIVPLTSPAGGELADFPSADATGVLTFEAVYDVRNAATYGSGANSTGFDSNNLFPLDLREIVLHGMTLEEGQGANGGEADGTAGFKAVLPVASGEIAFIPEPGSLTLALIGSLGVMSLVRRRR